MRANDIATPPRKPYPQTLFHAMAQLPLQPASAMPSVIAGMPAWLAYSLLTIVLWGAWGAVSKIASDDIDANTNQIYFTVGLLPLIFIMLRSSRLREGTQRGAGAAWAFFTGILGGVGNIAFFRALSTGGKVSIVAPSTALFPLVTVVLAMAFLHERLSNPQKAGLVLALVSIVLLTI